MAYKYNGEKNLSLIDLFLSGATIVGGLGSIVSGVMTQDLETILVGSGLFIGGSILNCGAYLRAYGETVIEYLNDHEER